MASIQEELWENPWISASNDLGIQSRRLERVEKLLEEIRKLNERIDKLENLLQINKEGGEGRGRMYRR